MLKNGWSPAEEAAQRLAPARRVFTVGIGTSYHAALVGAWLLRAAGADARAVSSFDFGLYPESADLRADAAWRLDYEDDQAVVFSRAASDTP